MAVSLTSLLNPLTFHPFSSSSNPNFNIVHLGFSRRRKRMKERNHRCSIIASSSSTEKSTKLVTFLGKGGSGKTTAAVFAAQHYAKEGFSTCLVTHSQDLVAEYLLNCKIGTDPANCSNNLSAVRLETTKMILEPLKRLKEADAHVNLSQGVLEGIVGEELGVLPGMDSMFSAFALEKFVGILGIKYPRNQFVKNFDVVVYDGISSDETLRMMSAASNARLYVKYLRSIAEKTEFGRLAGPTILRLVDETTGLSGGNSSFNGKLSAEIWDSLERVLERGVSAFGDPQRFGCYIVTDPKNSMSVNTALRYWGCAIQAGANISGAFGIASHESTVEQLENVKKSFLPLSFSLIPNLAKYSPLDWDVILSEPQSMDARNILQMQMEKASSVISSVKIDPAKRCVTLFMPGFEKSDIKLYQYRGGSELLVEAGDQRRIIVLPREIQGKVGGAKFIERTLVITMR